MIVINIKDGYNINRKNVKYNFVTDEKLSLLSWINKPSLFNTVVPNHHRNTEFFFWKTGIKIKEKHIDKTYRRTLSLLLLLLMAIYVFILINRLLQLSWGCRTIY